MGKILLYTRLFLFCCPFDSQKASAGMHRNVTQLELPKWFCTVSETYRKGQHRLTPFEIIVFVLFRPKRGGSSDIWQVINRCDIVRSFRCYDDLMCFIINTILTISAIWKLFVMHWISFSLDANWVAHSANDGGSWKLRKYFSKKSSSHGHPWNSRTTCLTNVENINWAWDGVKFRQKQKWMTQNCKSIVTTL